MCLMDRYSSCATTEWDSTWRTSSNSSFLFGGFIATPSSRAPASDSPRYSASFACTAAGSGRKATPGSARRFISRSKQNGEPDLTKTKLILLVEDNPDGELLTL